MGTSHLDPSTDLLHGHLARLRDDLLTALQGQHALLKYELTRSHEDVAEALSATAVTTLTVPAQSQNPERITLIVAYVGTGKGLLELGNRDPIAINSTAQPVILPGRWTLEATDTRTLSSVTIAADGTPGARGSGASTYLYLALFGEEIPRGGLSF